MKAFTVWSVRITDSEYKCVTSLFSTEEAAKNYAFKYRARGQYVEIQELEVME